MLFERVAVFFRDGHGPRLPARGKTQIAGQVRHVDHVAEHYHAGVPVGSGISSFRSSAGKKDPRGRFGALNVANRRVLLDNSLIFGGFHFNDLRQNLRRIRRRFHY